MDVIGENDPGFDIERPFAFRNPNGLAKPVDFVQKKITLAVSERDGKKHRGAGNLRAAIAGHGPGIGEQV